MTPLIIHGHFYQPPRENPWTGIIDPEPGALPFHDWNERIHAECYQPNSEVRIVVGGAEQIVNNYALISFDFGPPCFLLQQHHRGNLQPHNLADAQTPPAGGHATPLRRPTPCNPALCTDATKPRKCVGYS